MYIIKIYHLVTMSYDSLSQTTLKVTHLEPHPIADMIKFKVRNRNRLIFQRQKRFRDSVKPWLESPLDSEEHDELIQTIKQRTANSEYYVGKLLIQELWILAQHKKEAFNKYSSVLQKYDMKLSELNKKMENVYDAEYYEQCIDDMDYVKSLYEENYIDYKNKYEIQIHIRNGTLKKYEDDLFCL
jgi:hypothetical protein